LQGKNDQVTENGKGEKKIEMHIKNGKDTGCLGKLLQ